MEPIDVILSWLNRRLKQNKVYIKDKDKRNTEEMKFYYIGFRAALEETRKMVIKTKLEEENGNKEYALCLDRRGSMETRDYLKDEMKRLNRINDSLEKKINNNQVVANEPEQIVNNVKAMCEIANTNVI